MSQVRIMKRVESRGVNKFDLDVYWPRVGTYKRFLATVVPMDEESSRFASH